VDRRCGKQQHTSWGGKKKKTPMGGQDQRFLRNWGKVNRKNEDETEERKENGGHHEPTHTNNRALGVRAEKRWGEEWGESLQPSEDSESRVMEGDGFSQGNRTVRDRQVHFQARGRRGRGFGGEPCTGEKMVAMRKCGQSFAGGNQPLQ